MSNADDGKSSEVVPVTRVPADGFTFYESDSAPSGDKQPPTTMAAGCVWLEHAASVPVDSVTCRTSSVSIPAPVARPISPPQTARRRDPGHARRPGACAPAPCA